MSSVTTLAPPSGTPRAPTAGDHDHDDGREHRQHETTDRPTAPIVDAPLRHAARR